MSEDSYLIKQTGLLLIGPKSIFQLKINVVILGPRGTFKPLEKELRCTKFKVLKVVCEVSTISDNLGCQHSHLIGDFRGLHASMC